MSRVVPLLGMMTMREMAEDHARHKQWQATLNPSDPRHDEMFAFDLERGYLDIYWGGYEYSYELKRIRTPDRFLAFLQHIGQKTWKQTTPSRIAALIRAVSKHFGWDLHSPAVAARAAHFPPKPRTTSNTAERAKITPKLRFDVLMRDDYRCRACGFSVESGAHLHLDHIVPISKGGTSDFNNLQALCSACNMGKGAR